MALLKRERRRLRSYRLISEFFRAFSLMAVAAIGAFCLYRILLILKLTSTYALEVSLLGLGTLLLMICWNGFSRRRVWSHLSFAEVADEIESQNPYFKSHPHERSELRIAGSFLDEQRSEESEAFRLAHIQRIDSRVGDWAWSLRPRKALGLWLATLGFFTVVLSQFPQLNEVGLPKTGFMWSPQGHEVLLPFPDAQWEQRAGSISTTMGSKVRFEAPKTSLQPYVFVQLNDRWSVFPCDQFCEFEVRGSGQYSVGNLLRRSAAFPIQSFMDEPPRSAIWVKVNGDMVPGASLQLLNIKDLKLELTATDDLRLSKLVLIHKYMESEEVIDTIKAEGKAFRTSYTLKMNGWKGGLHLIFVEPHDDFASSRSEPLQITYNDESTLREKRLRDLEALINEWTHVLADLIESKLDKKLSESLRSRLKEIQYPSMESSGLMAAYIKELQSLSDRIQGWIDIRSPMTQVDDLIKRTERSILYGLSLLFQERAGDIGQTAADLKSSQADLSKLLEQIKSGKLDINSETLEEAFKELAKQLEELQKKISQLPKGPQDDMINREALESQAQEAQSLADRIEDIRKQAQSGDSKGALRELESLLNQLSILSREMERGLDQWQQNMDQGALQKSQEFAKKIDQIKKQQEDLIKATESAKEKLEKLEQKPFSIKDKKDLNEQEKLEQQIESLESKQEKLSEDLKEAGQQFDKALEGTEWSQLFRSEEAKALESEAGERMIESKEGLDSFRMMESVTNQKEAVEMLKKMSEGQKQMQQQMQQMSESMSPSAPEKMEILGSEGKGEKERKRKIMESLKQNVGEKYQKSHERYFEELLQR